MTMANHSMPSLECAICQEVLQAPMLLSPCQHVFCGACLTENSAKKATSATASSRTCPLCRCPVTSATPDAATEALLASTKLRCEACAAEMPASALRSHKSTCAAHAQQEKDAQAAATTAAATTAAAGSTGTGGAAPPSAPNRSTFACPFPSCAADHLDCKDLIAHFDAAHRGETLAACCPVCKTMPWGDPNYVSRDLVGHVKLRHNFTYDEFVPYADAADERSIMEAVLRQSMADQ